MDISKNILFKPISLKRILKGLLVVFLTFTVVLYWLDIWYLSSGEEDSAPEQLTQSQEASEDTPCNVAAIRLRGLLTIYPERDNDSEDEASEDSASSEQTSSDDVTFTLDSAAKDTAIKAALIEIDSYGGQPVAGEEIANAIKRFGKPVVAVIRQAGTSAAYWAATGADTIFASANSDVGSIGVTVSYLENVKKNEKEGYVYQELHSGKYKDMMNPDKPLTAEERVLLERDLAILHENFINAVAENRKMNVGDVRALADGSSMLGSMALEKKLIDKIGGLSEARSWLTEKIGEEPEVCW